MIPPELAALMLAYTQSTGLNLTLSYERQHTLSEIHARGITPADVQAVLEHLKNLIRTGAKGYADSSLDWRNSMANVDTLEERVLRLRQRKLRSRKIPNQVSESRHLNGNIVNFLAEEKPPEPKPIDVKNSLINLANQIKSA